MSSRISKSQLIDLMAMKAKMSKASAGVALNSFLETVIDNLKMGNEISIPGFGTYKAGKRSARTGRNPQTGKEIKIPATNYPKFKPGNRMKDAVKV